LIDKQIEWIEKRLLSEQNSANYQTQCQSLKNPRWTSNRIELVELVYALHETGCFRGTSLKELFIYIGKTFGYEIINYYRLFWDIKNRIGEERTFFLNKLRKTLSDKLVRMDSGLRS
jgi:hypothetical protein